MSFAPTLVCDKVLDASAYRFQIASDTGFSSLCADTEVAANELSPTGFIPISSVLTYYWRVRAKVGDQWKNWSTQLASFILSSSQMSPSSPSNNGTTLDSTPSLDWTDVSGASGYDIRFADSEAGLSSASAKQWTSTSSVIEAPDALDFDKTWYWQVCAKNGDGVHGAWSNIWNFTVGIVAVAGGTFDNGTANMTVSSFEMGKYEVTQDQYAEVMGLNPSYFSSNASSCPVEKVTWFDAVEFCNKLSTLLGYDPVYTISGRAPASGYPITYAMVTADWSKDGYRLPTEAEWEFAARGGNLSLGFTYPGSNNFYSVAWIDSNSGMTTHPVGTKAPNELGLYDMLGNVSEWCWDWFGSYPDSAQTDYRGASLGNSRVDRGASYGNTSGDFYFFCRWDYSPSFYSSTQGFRIARRP